MTEKESLRFPHEERLKRRQDIQAVFKKGASVSCPGARLFFLRENEGGRRIAFTFARKFGNAVKRNRTRRLSREAYRHLRTKIKGGYDLVLLVYPDKNNSLEGKKSLDSFSARLRQMRFLLVRAGLFTAEALS
jgi:ribonuclease P protein component